MHRKTLETGAEANRTKETEKTKIFDAVGKDAYMCLKCREEKTRKDRKEERKVNDGDTAAQYAEEEHDHMERDLGDYSLPPQLM